ncbi:MAG: hypothetical protein U5J98_09380 [Halobacteriales archaeon]|nr:hypothetical protein [Halobacteriales archaeon]
MTRTTHTCAGCGRRLASKRDLRAEQGAVRSRYRCTDCGTTVPGLVAEKLKHQTQH